MKYLSLLFIMALPGFVCASPLIQIASNQDIAIAPSDTLKTESIQEIHCTQEGVLTMTLHEDIKARYLLLHTDGKLIADLGYRHLTAGKQTIHAGNPLSSGNYLLGTQARGGELKTYKFNVE